MEEETFSHSLPTIIQKDGIIVKAIRNFISLLFVFICGDSWEDV